jgi:hypothetical protein
MSKFIFFTEFPTFFLKTNTESQIYLKLSFLKYFSLKIG